MKNFGLWLTVCRKSYFSIFVFIFQIANDYCQKSYGKISSFIIDFEGSYEVLLRHEYFLSKYFWQWNNGTFEKFWNFHGNAICLFFLNERNIGTSLLMIHLKCTVAHYTNLNSSSINKHYLRVAEYAISCFFNFSFMFILTRLL